jgi:two-component system phosphate regulon sensor histidine kinase PhoR
MLRTSFFLKLLGSYVALVIVTASIFGFYQQRKIERDANKAVERRLRDHAELLRALAAPYFEGRDSKDEMRRCVQAAGESLRTRFTVIDARGEVLVDTDLPADQSALSESEVAYLLDAVRKVSGAVSGYEGLNRRFSYLALPLKQKPEKESDAGPEAVHVVRAAVPRRDLEGSLSDLRVNILMSAGVAVLIAGLLGLFVARRVSRPLHEIQRAATGVASGNYEARASVRSADEFGALSQSFNIMVRELGRRMETITTDRNKLLTILGGMVEGVIAIDQDERVLHINRIAARWLQTTADGSIGRLIWEVTRKAEVCAALGQAMESGDEVHDEIVLPDSREDQILELVAAPLVDSKGENAGAIVVLHDVTRLRKLEVVRSDFVANVSHELKTPLTVIRGAVETMLEDGSEMPEAIRERFLTKVMTQSNRLSSLVSDLLVLSRVEAPNASHEFDDVDLKLIVQESLRGLQPVAEKKAIRVSSELPEASIIISGDPEALRQVADNLLDNALKYSGAGTRVTARLQIRDQRIRFEVEDTGIGIAPQDRERIFERFYRVDKARSRELGGTGLGLSIVKHIVLAHNGEIGVESQPGQGSTFWIEFPALG